MAYSLTNRYSRELRPIKNCPYSHKWQLVDWVVEYRKFKRSTANNLTKRQLYAIWYKS